MKLLNRFIYCRWLLCATEMSSNIFRSLFFISSILLVCFPNSKIFFISVSFFFCFCSCVSCFFRFAQSVSVQFCVFSSCLVFFDELKWFLSRGAEYIILRVRFAYNWNWLYTRFGFTALSELTWCLFHVFALFALSLVPFVCMRIGFSVSIRSLLRSFKAFSYCFCRFITFMNSQYT